MLKTRIAYLRSKKDGKLIGTEDTVQEALKANMMVRDYEKALIKANPQLEITINIERRS